MKEIFYEVHFYRVDGYGRGDIMQEFGSVRASNEVEAWAKAKAAYPREDIAGLYYDEWYDRRWYTLDQTGAVVLGVLEFRNGKRGIYPKG